MHRSHSKLEIRTTAIRATSAGTTPLSYDNEGRVTGISYPSGATNSFTYNGLDTRTGKTDSAGTKSFLRDGTDVTSPVLSDGAATYTPGISESRTGISTFYGHDRLGTNNLQTGASQTVTNQKVYDAFGMLESSSSYTSTSFGFVGAFGYQEDPDSELMLLGHRYYDASVGRFITRDPAKDGDNCYEYVRNNPLKQIDPSGYGINWSGLQGILESVLPKQIGPVTIGPKGVTIAGSKGGNGVTTSGTVTVGPTGVVSGTGTITVPMPGGGTTTITIVNGIATGQKPTGSQSISYKPKKGPPVTVTHTDGGVTTITVTFGGTTISVSWNNGKPSIQIGGSIKF